MTNFFPFSSSFMIILIFSLIPMLFSWNNLKGEKDGNKWRRRKIGRIRKISRFLAIEFHCLSKKLLFFFFWLFFWQCLPTIHTILSILTLEWCSAIDFSWIASQRTITRIMVLPSRIQGDIQTSTTVCSWLFSIYAFCRWLLSSGIFGFQCVFLYFSIGFYSCTTCCCMQMNKYVIFIEPILFHACLYPG